MNNQWMVLAWAMCIPFFSYSAESKPLDETGLIDKQIENLKQELKDDHLIEMQKEVNGQGYMIADWKKYAEEIQQVSEYEKKDRLIQAEIKNLESLKMTKQKANSPST